MPEKRLFEKVSSVLGPLYSQPLAGQEVSRTVPKTQKQNPKTRPTPAGRNRLLHDQTTPGIRHQRPHLLESMPWTIASGHHPQSNDYVTI